MSIGTFTLNKKAPTIALAPFCSGTDLACNVGPILGVIPIALGFLGNDFPHLGAVLASEGMGVPEVMFPHMVGVVGNDKVIKPVVVLDAVDVVDDLGGGQPPTNGLLHDVAVVEHLFAVYGDSHIAVLESPGESVRIPAELGVPVSVDAPIMLTANPATNAERLAASLRAGVSHADTLVKRFN